MKLLLSGSNLIWPLNHALLFSLMSNEHFYKWKQLWPTELSFLASRANLLSLLRCCVHLWKQRKNILRTLVIFHTWWQKSKYRKMWTESHTLDCSFSLQIWWSITLKFVTIKPTASAPVFHTPEVRPVSGGTFTYIHIKKSLPWHSWMLFYLPTIFDFLFKKVVLICYLELN